MQESLMWDLNLKEKIRNFTWWWWWWLLFIKDPENPRRSRQLMILWSTKNVDRIIVNDIPWERNLPITERPLGDVEGAWAGGKETRFDGMTAAWFFDGRRMHEPFVLEKNDFTVRRDAGGERGELRPESEHGLTLEGDPKGYRLRIRKDGWDLDFLMTPWSDFMSRQRFKAARYVGKYGYNILRIYGSKLAGTIGHDGGNEAVSGSAYFQKVMVNAPATPWYWGTFHVDDGSYIDYFNPHIGPPMWRRTEAPRSGWDWGEIRLSKHMQFYHAGEDRVHEMRKLKVRKEWSADGLPIFNVLGRSKDGRTELELRLASYSRAYWRFEQKYLRWFRSILYYNEYPVEVERAVLRDAGQKLDILDLGPVTGNCEHTWGKLL
ncbi:MAG: hypothetical protein FJ149_06120 [Euryarchaeota archaeon]|nr:hypothetical protein [Euryarchaeota archaeon]